MSGYAWPAWAEAILQAQPSVSFAVRSPSSGQVVAQVADQGEAEARQAIERSAAAFEQWRQTTPYERAALLRRWFNAITDHAPTLARLTALEMGKPITEALGEVRYAAAFVEWYAEEAKRVYGDVIPNHLPHKRLFAIKQPVGPAYAITPWNFPSAMVTRKAAPALAVGCTMILKPAEQSPLTALALAALWQQVGGPPDALIVLTCADPVPVSQVMFADERVRKLSFTGSTEVGQLLYRQAAHTVKRLSLELGGHAPFIIFDDADIPHAVREVVASKFRNAGQTCVCANRIYVQAGIAQAFGEQLAEAVAALRLGDPLDEATQIGPLVDEAGLAKVQRHVDDARQRGARLLVGGARQGGLFFQPTVLADVARDALIMTEETFGPVAPLVAFATEDEAIRLANDTPFGLAAYLYTENISRGVRVAEALEYGIVGLNDGVPSTAQAPFGGVKQSGLGREGGKWGIEEYLEVKYVSLALR